MAQNKTNLLTDNSEVDFTVPRWRVLEIHPAPVDTLIGQLDIVNDQSGRRGRPEICPFPENGGRRPQLRLVELSTSDVEAETKGQSETGE